MARPKGVKITNLTPDNVAALELARKAGFLPNALVVTPTTATWPLTFNAAGALQTVQDAIAGTTGTTRRALHAPRRKLEKLVRPGSTPTTDGPAVSKASRRLTPAKCNHQQPEGGQSIGNGRIKCLCCGLIWDTADVTTQGDRFTVNPPKPKAQRPATARQGGVAPAQVIQADPIVEKLQKAAQAGQSAARQLLTDVTGQAQFLTVAHGSEFLIVDLDAATVIASCARMGDADRITKALNAG